MIPENNNPLLTNNIWIQTGSGRAFDMATSEPNFLDLARGLSKICRFGGNTKEFLFYSVAEHCTLMADWAFKIYNDPQLAWDCLLHDSPEYVIIDLVSPLKNHLPHYCNLDSELSARFSRKYQFGHSQLVSEIDKRILMDEKIYVLAKCEREWGYPSSDTLPLGVEFQCNYPPDAFVQFLYAVSRYVPKNTREIVTQELGEFGDLLSIRDSKW